MGLPMNSIHAPTVPSGTASPAPGPAETAVDPSSLPQLIAEKDRMESELKVLSSVLDSHGVNMNTSLTTFDGYPRDDIDVAQIRITRARIIPLRNDYKALMSRIELALHAHHAALQQGQPQDTLPTSSASLVPPNSTSDRPTETSDTIIETPFAKVNTVAPGSPADDAGLKAGDRIRRFGHVNWMNHEKLSKVAETVQRNEGVS
ncbi:MAG: putative 26S proteasome regulatory subunit [Caeruleum heppii]|nr:MAG: putative 26S proteasome regulatory subunit [Caeruleum heppii]